MRLPPELNLRTILSRKNHLLRQIETLKKSNRQLVEKLEAAQRAKTLAENQAEDLRKDKERQRSRIAEGKKLVENANRATEQLRTKCEGLESENEKLRNRSHRKS